MESQKTGNPAVRNGLIFGGILAAANVVKIIIQWAVLGSYSAITQSANGLTSTTIASNNTTTLLTCVLFIVALALAFIAGMKAAKTSNRVGAGSIAGLLTCLIGTLVGSGLNTVLTLVLVVPNVQIPANSTLSQSDAHSALIGVVIGALVLSIASILGLARAWVH